MSNDNYDLIIKLRIVDYTNPTNAINDIACQLEDFDYVENIELICAEKLKYNKYNDSWEKYYPNMIVDKWNLKG